MTLLDEARAMTLAVLSEADEAVDVPRPRRGSRERRAWDALVAAGYVREVKVGGRWRGAITVAGFDYLDARRAS